MTILVDDLLPNELRAMVEPLLPVPPRPPYGGRRRAVPDRNCFAAIVYMARTWAPFDRGKPGSKLHLVCEGGGLPLTVVVTAANLVDTTMFVAALDDVPPIRTPSGRRRTGQRRSTRTRATTARPTGPGCGGVGSGRGSLGVGWSRRRGWAGIGGRSSGRCRG